MLHRFGRFLCQILLILRLWAPGFCAIVDTMSTDGSSLGLRQLNRLRVIETLYRHPETTRFELAHIARMAQ